MIRCLLEGQNTLHELRQHPEVYERVCTIKSQRERYLVVHCMLHEGNPTETVERARASVEDAICQALPNIAMTTLEALGWEAVADWLVRCPLDFPDPPEADHA
jgi:hypothetical protein